MGDADKDVDTWIAKVGDFLYLTEANSRQQVAYAATLLQEAAADWWVALLQGKEAEAARRIGQSSQYCCPNVLAAPLASIGQGQN